MNDFVNTCDRSEQREAVGDAESTSENRPMRSVHTTNLADIFRRLGISVFVSTYQAGKLIIVRADDDKLSVTDGTMSGNAHSGGGFYMNDGAVSVSHTTVNKS